MVFSVRFIGSATGNRLTKFRPKLTELTSPTTLTVAGGGAGDAERTYAFLSKRQKAHLVGVA